MNGISAGEYQDWLSFHCGYDPGSWIVTRSSALCPTVNCKAIERPSEIQGTQLFFHRSIALM
jgi:hypothetical protein